MHARLSGLLLLVLFACDSAVDAQATSPAAAIDGRLVGSWAINIPEMYASRHRDWASFTASAGMGILTIDARGGYTWKKEGNTKTGATAAYAPGRGARAGVSYYLVNDGRDDFYISFQSCRGSGCLEVVSPRTHNTVAYGARWNPE
ncbi:MAG: hypothetical protein M3P24_05145 [Gemmatimonadota bacterium]|nr:hypothetical protein [Gemmatimonadota bacterium]